MSIEIEEIEYLRHGARPLLARVFKPRAGASGGPFPAVVQVHGGAWCDHDRQKDSILNISLAQAGIVVAAIDFRVPPEAGYPASIADGNYAVRWLKANAARFGSRADLVGVMGTSSGGHQAILAALRPADARYCATPLPAGSAQVDARVRFAVLCYPVMDPLFRYHYAQRVAKEESPWAKRYAGHILPNHHKYWGSEAAMAEGSPVLALERGEALDKPPVFCVLADGDRSHPGESIERFVELYRKAGGEIEFRIVEHKDADFFNMEPSSGAALEATRRIVDFIRRHAAGRSGSA